MTTEDAMTEVNGGKEAKQPVDIIEKSIGILGRWHIWVCFLIFLVKFPVAWHQLNIVFLAPPVEFTCLDEGTDKCASNCTQHVFDRSIFTETIVTQWDLVCSRTFLTQLAQMITMLGILIGNMVFGYFSDRFGRKLPLTAAVVLQVLSGTGAAFSSSSFALFMVLRFLSALATGGTMVTSFVLVMELIGTEWRTAIGILYQIPFNLGHLLLPLVAYFLRDWRYYQMAISIPAVVLVSYYWLLPESPRWLLNVGKRDEAVEVLQKAARFNRLPVENISGDVDAYLQDKQVKVEEKANITHLVRTPVIRVYTLCICFNWLVCGLCFFGLAQYMGQLGGDIFVNVALSAMIQVPSTLFSIWAVRVIGRKRTLIASNALVGVACLLIAVLPEDPSWIRVALGSVGMFALAVSFPTVYIYSGELFPTMIRNIGVGTSSMCARIGSMAAPFVAGLGTVSYPWVPTLIFGVVPLLGAVLCFKLPETLDCKLPDTVEEAEQYAQKKIKA